MADAEQKKGYMRLNHFHGLRLESNDFQVGEEYHTNKKKLHNKVFHGYGVVQGYMDGLMVVARKFKLPATAYVVIKFVDEPTDFVVNAANPKYKGHKRVLETSKIEIVA